MGERMTELNMAGLHSFHFTFMVMAALLLVAAGFFDARNFRIPNWVWAALLGLFPLHVLSSPVEMEWTQHLGVFGVVLAIGFVLFAGNFAGAGDVKLLAAIALWAGPQYIGALLVVTAFSGGLLAVGFSVNAWFKLRLQPQVATAEGALDVLTKTPIPYGVAIACGGLVSLGLSAAALF